MVDAITQLVEGAMASPWVLLALFAVAAIDGFFPVVPSESLVVTAGVFAAATGEPSLPVVIIAAALGAITGDHVSYLLGTRASGRVARRRAFGWAARMLDERGGTILVVARYIPGGRTAVTLTSGAVRFPLRTFSLYDGIAGLSWGLYSALVGFIGGAAFEEQPLAGLALGLGLAIGVAALVEVVRHLRARSAHAAEDGAVPDERPAGPVAGSSEPGRLVTEQRRAVPAQQPA